MYGAQSPDLNPMEHVWQRLDFKCRFRQCNAEEQLFEVLKNEWKKLTIFIILFVTVRANDEGLTLETSALKLLTVANLLYQLG